MMHYEFFGGRVRRLLFWISAIVKKLLSLVGLTLAVMSNAYADDRLFPTDILNKGEVDIRLSIGHDSHSQDINFNGNPGRSSFSQTSEEFQIRYGLGADWHVGMGLSYDSQHVVNEDFRNPAGHFSSRRGEGEQNPVIWASYGMINDAASPLSLSAALVVSPDTTGDAKTSYSGRLTAGWKSDDTLKYYGQLTANFRDDFGFGGYNIGVGAYKRLSEVLTLIPHAHFSRNESTNIWSSWDQYGVGLSAHVRLSESSYLIPELSFYMNGDRNTNDQLFHVDQSRNGKAFRLGFYHQF